MEWKLVLNAQSTTTITELDQGNPFLGYSVLFSTYYTILVCFMFLCYKNELKSE